MGGFATIGEVFFARRHRMMMASLLNHGQTGLDERKTDGKMGYFPVGSNLDGKNDDQFGLVSLRP